MKKFNLEKALVGDAVVTRDGKNVKVFFVSDKGDLYPIKGVVDINTYWEIQTWDKEGLYHNTANPNNMDLFMKPVKKKLYIAIKNTSLPCSSLEPSKFFYATSNAYLSKDDVLECAIEAVHQIVEVEIDV